MYQQNEVKLDDVFEQISERNFNNRFINFKELGEGAGSNVFSAFDQQANRQVAIKLYNKTQIKRQYNNDIIREVQILRKITGNYCDYFVQFFNAYKIMKQNFTNDYCLVEERCVGSLQSYIKSQQYKDLTEKAKIKLCLHVCQGIQILHSTFSIMHRDIKPANFLMAERDGEQIPVVSDFGHSKLYQTNIANTTYRGSIKYVNPFIISSQEGLLNYSFQFDIYSIGILLLELTAGKFLFQITQQSSSPTKFIRKLSQELQKTGDLLKKIQNLSQPMRQVIFNCITNKNYSAIQVVSDLKKILDKMQTQEGSNKFLKKRHFEQPIMQLLKIQQQIQRDEPKNQKLSTFQSVQDSQEVKYNQMKEQQIHIQENFQKQEQNNFQMKIISSCKTESKISQLKKNLKNYSQICVSLVDNQEQICHQNQKIQKQNHQPESRQSKKQKSNILKRLQSIKHKPSIKFENYKAEQTPKGISTLKKIQLDLEQNSKSLQQLQKLRKYQSSFKKLQQIQLQIKSYHKIDFISQKKLIIFAFVYLVKKINDQCNSQKSNNNYTNKYTKDYLQRLTLIKQKYLREFLDSSQDKIGTKRVKLLKDNHTSQKELKDQLENISKNIEVSQLHSRVKRIYE